MSPFYENIFLLLGTIIGAGIFSLPIALKQTGWLFFLFTITGLSLLLAQTDSLFREIVESIPEKHQLPGYAKIILGDKISKLSTFLLLVSTFGALLAYLIIGGDFLGNVLQISSWYGSIIFFVAIFLITFFAGKKIEEFDVLFTVIKIVLIVGIIVSCLGPLTGFAIRFIPAVGNNPLGGYGSILFALTGISIIPELKKTKHIHKSILIAEIIVLVFYLLFSVMLYPYLSADSFVFKSLLFDITGVFTILSPYLMLSMVGNDLLVKDLKVNKNHSYIMMLGIPILLFLVGFTSFMNVISFTGGVFLGSMVLIVTFMYKKKFPHKHTLVIPIIQIVFIIGVILEIWQFVF